MPENEAQSVQYLAGRVDQALQSVDRVQRLTTVISDLTPQLQQHPDSAAYTALVAAIEEVVKTWEATDEAFKRVWQIYREDGDLDDTLDGLLLINDYQLVNLVEQGRGHCELIETIYRQRLKDWFEQQLNGPDFAAIKQVFKQLGQADLDAFRPMIEVAYHVEQVANDVINAVEDGETEQARTTAKGLRRTISPLRTAINRSLGELEQVQSRFAAFSLPSAMTGGGTPAAWNPAWRKELYDCLIDAYRYNSLERMLQFSLDKRLDLIAAPGNFADTVTQLIGTAEREDWVSELVFEAHQFNPTHMRLAQLAQHVQAMQGNG